MLEPNYRKLICELLVQFYHLGWATGTGGGMAIKNKATGNIVMSPSAVQKERLKPHNIFVLDRDAKVVEPGIVTDADTLGVLTKQLRLTACFSLFMACFEVHSSTGCVIHSHSKNVALVSLMFEDAVEIAGLEMIKGISGHSNIEPCVIPIIQNTPQESQLTARLQRALEQYPTSFGVIVRGHGIYVFGENWQAAKQHAECYDYLFATIIEMRKLNVGQSNARLFQTQYFDRFPVRTADIEHDDDRVIADTAEHEQHPHYALFLVHTHPFLARCRHDMKPVPMIRSLVWQSHDHSVLMINQRIIPQQFGTVRCHTYQDMAHHIQTMTIRGAPAIGAAAAYGMALAALQFQKQQKGSDTSTNSTLTEFVQFMKMAKSTLDASRPTAVNLVWATNRMQNILNECVKLVLQSSTAASSQWLRDLTQILLTEAHNVAQEDIDICARLGINGSTLIESGNGILHHCNTGSLAAVCGGTALSAITCAYYEGKDIRVYVDETRPRLQGSRLTSWELSRMRIAHKIVVDGCVAHLLSHGLIQCVIVGCDRVARNGDTANKIGTHTAAVVAHEYGIPFYISCPVSTIDAECTNGSQIVIEERSHAEIKQIGSVCVANADSDCFNPAFDVTPHKFITAFITEYGICYPPFTKSLGQAVKQHRQETHQRQREMVRKLSIRNGIHHGNSNTRTNGAKL
eukprot:CAMPEP_0202692684 /NCGR_PEP_ID=MMETSP1385-20130828/7002_1 /ASSEMBLY_ACC=CAM_ASM_000861 /TAXON_ID=933848 /ORGANISM="Elphidium margaritaceum" /LENGTH=685 /DNA_ID=CAMNT_0049348263 /DNA_START=99 /DNA_END=2156 /DNA_ORIENTATION=+